MPYLECCNRRRFCNAYKIENISGLVLNIAYYLEACPICGHSVLIIQRFVFDGSMSEVRKINDKARKLFDKIRPTIICKYVSTEAGGSSYFLKCNEYGSIKRCYSNLSSLQMGLFDNLDLPILPKKLPLPESSHRQREYFP